jgi:hypothetical protein
MVTVQVVDTVLPRADGRQWTPEHYRRRDAVLAALGVPAFGKHPRL